MIDRNYQNFKILVFITALLSSILISQDVKKVQDIRGKVTAKESGESLVSANVYLIDSNRGTTTNLNGNFVLPDVEMKQCTIRVSYIGYLSKEIIIDNLQKNKVYKVELSVKSYKQSSVLVTAEKYKIWKKSENVGQITISPKQLSILPSLGDVDIFRSLQLLPGISGISDGSTGLYIRGGTPDQNLVLLDGMTVYHVDHFFGFFSAFNADAIKDVQVHKGGFSAKYGGRLSSVVDLTGKTGNLNKTKVSIGANLLSANAIAEIPLSNKGSLVISGRRSFADYLDSGFYDTIYNLFSGAEEQPEMQGRNRFAQYETATPSFYFYDLNAKLSYALSNDDFLSVSFYNGEDYLDESEENSLPSPAGTTGNLGERIDNNITNWGNLGASVKWTRQWNSRFFSSVLFAASNYFSDKNREIGFESATEDTNQNFGARSFKSLEDNDVTDYSFKIDNDITLNSDHKISFGLWASNIKSKFLFTINDTLNLIDQDNFANLYSIYLMDNWKISDKLKMDIGLRSSYYDNTSEFYLSPRLSLSYTISPNLTVKGAWGHYYQYTNRITSENVLENSRDFWLVSDNEIKPGFSEHYIFGLEYDTQNYLFSVEGYYKSLDNIVEFTQRTRRDPRFASNETENFQGNFLIGSGFSKGIEFLAQKKMGKFNGWISYTLGQVNYKFPEYNNGDYFPASHDRRHEFKVIGAYSIGKWNLSATWVFASGQAYTAPESQYYLDLLNGDTYSYTHVSNKNEYRLPDYHRLDLSASYKFKNKNFDGEFGLSIFNLYNNNNVWYRKYDLESTPVGITDVNMLGITPTVYVKLNF